MCLTVRLCYIVKARVSRNVGEGGSEESFGGADFLGLGKWCTRQRTLNKSGLLTVERQQVVGVSRVVPILFAYRFAIACPNEFVCLNEFCLYSVCKQHLNRLGFEWDGRKARGKNASSKKKDLPTPKNPQEFAAAAAAAACSRQAPQDHASANTRVVPQGAGQEEEPDTSILARSGCNQSLVGATCDGRYSCPICLLLPPECSVSARAKFLMGYLGRSDDDMAPLPDLSSLFNRSTKDSEAAPTQAIAMKEATQHLASTQSGLPGDADLHMCKTGEESSAAKESVVNSVQGQSDCTQMGKVVRVSQVT